MRELALQELHLGFEEDPLPPPQPPSPQLHTAGGGLGGGFFGAVAVSADASLGPVAVAAIPLTGFGFRVAPTGFRFGAAPSVTTETGAANAPAIPITEEGGVGLEVAATLQRLHSLEQVPRRQHPQQRMRQSYPHLSVLSHLLVCLGIVCLGPTLPQFSKMYQLRPRQSLLLLLL